MDQFLSFNFTDSLLADVLRDPTVQAMFAESCGGYMGALATSVNMLVGRFDRMVGPTKEEVIAYFLSEPFLQHFDRCFGDMPEDSDKRRAVLLEVHEQGIVRFNRAMLDPLGYEAFLALGARGVLSLDKYAILRFSCPLAACIIVNTIFPGRAATNPPSISELLLRALRSLSAHSCRQAFQLQSSTLETTFQHLLFGGLVSCTRPSVSVIPELSKMLGVTVPGSVDFYINSDMRWAIEIVVDGRGITEHISRFYKNGTYYNRPGKDYLVVDVRVTSDGKPTNVSKHTNCMSVFFNPTFQSCTVVVGKGSAIKITLKK